MINVDYLCFHGGTVYLRNTVSVLVVPAAFYLVLPLTSVSPRTVDSRTLALPFFCLFVHYRPGD
jgi:hypothetical protein